MLTLLPVFEDMEGVLHKISNGSVKACRRPMRICPSAELALRPVPRKLRGMDGTQIDVAVRRWMRPNSRLSVFERTAIERGPCWELWEAKGPLMDWEHYGSCLEYVRQMKFYPILLLC